MKIACTFGQCFFSGVHLSVRCAAGAKAVAFKVISKSLYPESLGVL